MAPSTSASTAYDDCGMEAWSRSWEKTACAVTRVRRPDRLPLCRPACPAAPGAPEAPGAPGTPSAPAGLAASGVLTAAPYDPFMAAVSRASGGSS